MSRYSIKLKNKKSILWINADSENLSERMCSFDDNGFSVAKVVKCSMAGIRPLRMG